MFHGKHSTMKGKTMIREIQPIASATDWQAWIETTRQTMTTTKRADAVAGVQSSIRQMNAEIARQTQRRTQAETMMRNRALSASIMQSFDGRLLELHQRLAVLIGLLREGLPTSDRQRRLEFVVDLDLAARAAYVRVMIGRAVWVIRTMRFPRHGLPSQFRTCMPEPVRGWEAYAADDAPAMTRQRPTAHQISEADRILPWFYLVPDAHDRAALWLRHIPLSWRKMADIMDRSHSWAVAAEGRAINQIVHGLGSDIAAIEK